MTSVEETDQAIVAALAADGRLSFTDLATKVGLSVSAAHQRVRRLEQRGIITGYGVRLAPDYEQGLVRAHVLLTVTPKLADKVVRSLQALAPVRTLHSVSGNFDMIVVVEAPAIRDLDLLLDQIGAMEGVERTSSSIILSTRIDR